MSRFKFQRYEKDEISDLITNYLNNGWDYSFSGKGYVVIFNSNDEFRLMDCINILSERLEFGNIKQIKAIKALNFLNLLYAKDGLTYFLYKKDTEMDDLEQELFTLMAPHSKSLVIIGL